MRILGIDTATWTASVALADGAGVRAERSVPAAPSHGNSLLPLIAEVLAAGGMSPRDLEAVAVSIGPGSFTGLRIGLSAAKGIALSRGLPIAGVPTLRALALAAGVTEGLVSPLLDARKGEVYTALFRAERGSLHTEIGECAVDLRTWLGRIAGPCTFLGDGVGLLAAAGVRPHWRILPFEEFHPQGAIIARLGAARIAAGDRDNLAALEPRYIRPPEAELKAAGP